MSYSVYQSKQGKQHILFFALPRIRGFFLLFILTVYIRFSGATDALLRCVTVGTKSDGTHYPNFLYLFLLCQPLLSTNQ